MAIVVVGTVVVACEVVVVGTVVAALVALEPRDRRNERNFMRDEDKKSNLQLMDI